MYADDLQQQLLILLEEDHEMMERGPAYFPAAATLADELIASGHNYNVIECIGKFNLLTFIVS